MTLTTTQFRVFGVVVDKKMLLRIGSTMAGLLATAIPIVFGLRPDLNEDFTHNNATDTTQCNGLVQEKMAEQITALQQQLIELTNRTC